MTDKQIDVVIQSYYDENEIGGSFASFKKAVLNQFKSKKESRIVEKTTNHVAKCAGELDPETMSVKDMSSSIQTYYDENEIGGSFAQFKKEVIRHLSKK
jgi:hypothetical protein